MGNPLWKDTVEDTAHMTRRPGIITKESTPADRKIPTIRTSCSMLVTPGPGRCLPDGVIPGGTPQEGMVRPG